MTDHDDVNDLPRDAASEAEGIAPYLMRPLRAPEQLDATFSARVMSAVHADARARARASSPGVASSRGWWRRQRTVHVSPLAGLAMAAGIAGLAVLSARGLRGPAVPPMMTTAAAPETVHVVRFVLVDRGATAVSLVGDFNEWTKGSTTLVESGRDGTWTVSVELPRGRHEYAFVVHRPNGEQWVADPFASHVRDDFGTESSVVTVGVRGPDGLSSSS
jgi:hypothetical protein